MASKARRPRVIVILSAIAAAIGLLFGVAAVAVHSVPSPSRPDWDNGNAVDAAPVAAPETTVWLPTHRPIPASLSSQLNAAATRDAETVIDIQHAEQLVHDFIPVRARAILDGDEETLRELDTGFALTADIANCGCASEPVAAGVGGVASAISLVPRQTHYPASFFTEALLFSPTGMHYRELVVMTRASANRPWKLAHDVVSVINGPEAAVRPGAFDGGGYNVVPAHLRIPPATLLALLAKQWQEQKNHGHGIGAPFAADEGFDFASHRQGEVTPIGLRARTSISVDPRDPVYDYGLDAGKAYVCGVVHIDVTWTAGPDAVPTQGPERHNWGPTVRPGVYGSIVEHRIMQPCVVLSPAPTALVEVDAGEDALAGAQGFSSGPA